MTEATDFAHASAFSGTWAILRAAVAERQYHTVVHLLCQGMGYKDHAEMVPLLRGALAEVTKKADEENPEAKWQQLRTSADAKAYDQTVNALCDGLCCRQPTDLLPLLRGTITEVIKREDRKTSTHRVKGSVSAYQRYKGQGQGREARGRDQEADALRRWRKTLRAVFSEEAASAMLSELCFEYEAEGFEAACQRLNVSWAEGTDYQCQMQEIDDLCLSRVLAPLLARYGFSPDAAGNQEVNSIMSDLSVQSSEVYEKKTQVQRLIFSYFTNLGKWT